MGMPKRIATRISASMGWEAVLADLLSSPLCRFAQMRSTLLLAQPGGLLNSEPIRDSSWCLTERTAD